MTKYLSVLTVVGLMLISMNPLVFPRGMGKGKGRDMMRHARFGICMAEKNLFPAYMLLKYKSEIGLNQEQVNKIEENHEMFQESVIRKNADIQVKELKIKSYLKKEDIDRKQLEKMIREVAKMRTDMQIYKMNFLLDLKDLLTTEQIEKIESLKKERRQRMFERRKGRKSEFRRERFNRNSTDMEFNEGELKNNEAENIPSDQLIES